MAEPRIRLPRNFRLGETIEVKTFIAHPMETGRRENPATGKTVPRDIIRFFTATYRGAEVFRADMHTGISANPFIAFYLQAGEPGELVCVWEDEEGRTWTARADVRPG